VFVNPPWESAEQIGQHFESCRRTAPTSTMAVFVLPKWSKFNELTKHRKLYITNSQLEHSCLLVSH
jgi:hypothetical protein